MVVAAAGWETESLYVPADVFVVSNGIYVAEVYPTANSRQDIQVEAAPSNWGPTHIVALVALCETADVDWIEIWSAPPSGVRIGGRHPQCAAGVSIPIHPSNPIQIRVGSTSAPTVHIALARRALCSR